MPRGRPELPVPELLPDLPLEPLPELALPLELVPELAPDDPDGAAHVPLWHVWPLPVQSTHAVPFEPHAVSSVPGEQPRLGSQQPLLQDGEHAVAASPEVPASSLGPPASSPTLPPTLPLLVPVVLPLLLALPLLVLPLPEGGDEAPTPASGKTFATVPASKRSL